MNDSLVCKRYELAQQVYAAHGVDTEQAMAAIDAIPISMHSWQGDDLLGFEGAEALTGGIQATGRGVSNTKHPVKTVDDLKGLKIRTIGSSAINDSFEAMGATTTAVAWKEVYTALQQGLCDGEDSTVNANLSMKFIEYTKYFTELNEIFQDLLVIVNGSVWAGLTPEQQAVLTQASKDAFAYGMEYSAKYRQEGFDQVAAEYPDFQIIKHEDISPEDYATFYDAATTVWPKYTEAIGEEVFNLTKGLVEQYS